MYTVDASVWVNGFDQRESGHDISRQLLEVLRTRALPIIEPVLALAEIAGAISRTRQAPSLADIVRVQTPEAALAELTVASEDETAPSSSC